jgi:general secretion pathway protein B
MSYILDALRRADSERERGAVPSLHSKQIASGVADADEGDDDVSGRGLRPVWWAVGGLSLALISVAAWMVVGRPAPEPEPVRAAVPIVAPPAVPPAPVAAYRPPQPMPEVPAAPPPAPARIAEVPPKPLFKPAVKPATTAVASPRDDDAPVPSISELPDDIRRQLPTLSVSGASYSKNPASRMLILNGQVFKEGDKVANDLVLEQIRLKSAVLSFKGRRYSVSF